MSRAYYNRGGVLNQKAHRQQSDQESLHDLDQSLRKLEGNIQHNKGAQNSSNLAGRVADSSSVDSRNHKQDYFDREFKRFQNQQAGDFRLEQDLNKYRNQKHSKTDAQKIRNYRSPHKEQTTQDQGIQANDYTKKPRRQEQYHLEHSENHSNFAKTNPEKWRQNNEKSHENLTDSKRNRSQEPALRKSLQDLIHEKMRNHKREEIRQAREAKYGRASPRTKSGPQEAKTENSSPRFLENYSQKKNSNRNKDRAKASGRKKFKEIDSDNSVDLDRDYEKEKQSPSRSNKPKKPQKYKGEIFNSKKPLKLAKQRQQIQLDKQDSILGGSNAAAHETTNVRLSNRLIALKVVDLYKLMQSKVYSAMGELEVGFPSNNQDDDNVTATEGQGQNDVSRRQLLKDDFEVESEFRNKKQQHLSVNVAKNVLLDPQLLAQNQLDDILGTNLIHVLTAFAICDDQRELFVQIKQYLVQNKIDMSQGFGVYDAQEWRLVRRCQTRFATQIFELAVQVAVTINWEKMVQSLLRFCQARKFLLTISPYEIESTISEEAYEVMNLLIKHGTYFSDHAKSIEVNSLPLASEASLEDQSPTRVNQKSLSKRKTTIFDDPKGNTSPNKSPSRLESQKSVMSRTITQLNLTNIEEAEGESLYKVIKTMVIDGQQTLVASHIVRQLFLMKPELTDLTIPNDLRHKHTKNFTGVIKELVINGNRDHVYQIINGNEEGFSEPFSEQLRKEIALEYFLFSVNHEQLEEALNVFQKFPQHIGVNYQVRSCQQILLSIRKSAAFMELKYLLILKMLPSMSPESMEDFLSSIERRISAPTEALATQRSVLIQNLAAIRVGLQTLWFLRQLTGRIPGSTDRIKDAFNKLDRQLSQILERMEHSQFEMLRLSGTSHKDLLGNDFVWYLQELRPPCVLQTRFVSNLVQQQCESSYFTQGNAFFADLTPHAILFDDLTSRARGYIKDYLQVPSKNSVSRTLPLKVQSKPVWIKSLNQKRLIDLLHSLALCCLVQYVAIIYLQDGVILADDSNFVEKLFLGNRRVMTRPLSGLLIFGCLATYIVFTNLASIALRIGQLKHQGEKRIRAAAIRRSSQSLIFSVWILQVVFFIYLILLPGTNKIYNSSSEIGVFELLYDNLEIYDSTTSGVFLNYRFIPALFMLSLWIDLIGKASRIRVLSPAVNTLTTVMEALLIAACQWTIGLILFSLVTQTWLGDFEGYSNPAETLQTLYTASLGMTQVSDEFSESQRPLVLVLHAIFALLCILGALAFFTSSITRALLKVQKEQMEGLDFGVQVLQEWKSTTYKATFGCMTVLPEIYALPFILLVYPILYLTNKCGKKHGARFNSFVSVCLYLPLYFGYLAIYVILGVLLLIPAYLVGIVQLMSLNPYREGGNQSVKCCKVTFFLFFGIPLLILAIFTNVYRLSKELFACQTKMKDNQTQNFSEANPSFNQDFATKQFSDALSMERDRQEPLNIRNLQRFYTVMVSQLSMHGVQGRAKNTGKGKVEASASKRVLDSLRKSLGVQNCIKMMFFGLIPGFMKGSATFMGQLKSERMTIQGQLICFNLLKQVIFSHRLPQNEISVGADIRLGLLFQYLQEIKQRLVARVYIENHKRGQVMNYIEFLRMDRSEINDTLAREILLADPLLVSSVLQAGGNYGLDQSSSGGQGSGGSVGRSNYRDAVEISQHRILKEMKMMQQTLLRQLREQSLTQALIHGVTIDDLQKKNLKDEDSDYREAEAQKEKEEDKVVIKRKMSTLDFTSFHAALAQSEFQNQQKQMALSRIKKQNVNI